MYTHEQHFFLLHTDTIGSELWLLQNPILSLSLSDFTGSKTRGRLKNTHACFKRRIRMKTRHARGLESTEEEEEGTTTTISNNNTKKATPTAAASTTTTTATTTTTTVTKTTSSVSRWCLLYPDTGRVRCDGPMNFRDTRGSLHAYVVPRNCVTFRSGGLDGGNSNRRIFARSVNIRVFQGGNKVHVNTVHSV